MASTINADDGVVSGSAGVKTSADNSGVLELQSNGTTQFTLGSSSVVINEAGADVDFRVEGDTDPNLFVVDASTDRVGVGTNAPNTKFEVYGGGNDNGLTITADDAASWGYTPNIFFRTQLTDGGAIGVSGRIKSYFVSPNNNFGMSFFTTLNGTNTERLYLDPSGNLGLGVTPSAWGTTNLKAFQIGNSAFWNQTNTDNVYLSSNNYYDGTNYKYIISDFAAEYSMTNGRHIWSTAAAGTAGNNVTFTEVMRLDASGNLGVGTSSPGARLDVAASGPVVRITDTRTNGAGVTYGTLEWKTSDGSAPASGIVGKIDVYDEGSGGTTYGDRGTMRFYINNSSALAERARLTAGGYFKASNAGTYDGATGTFHEFRQTVTDSETVNFSCTAASPYGLRVKYTAATPNGTANWFLFCQDSTAERATIRSNGGLANYSANNVNLASDERLKKDIAPLDSTWSKVKGIEVVNFRYKDCHEEDPALYGVIAQQVQPIVPELVVVTREAKEAQDAVLDDEGNVVTPAVEASPEYYGIREQPMYWLAIKALQEAMTRIEDLEAKVAALEAK